MYILKRSFLYIFRLAFIGILKISQIRNTLRPKENFYQNHLISTLKKDFLSKSPFTMRSYLPNELSNNPKNMRKKFCSTRLPRMPLMKWESRSCLRLKSCRRSTQNCWKKRKRPMPSTGVPVRKCGSF